MKTIEEFNTRFPNEDACYDHLFKARFGNGVYCPHCGHKHTYAFSDGKTYKCAACRQKFTLRTGSIFGESKLPLYKWFLAIYLLSASKKGISSVQLSEMVGVTQKTAWFLNHRIREVYAQGKNPLSGKVEMDETYLGGREINKHSTDKTEGTQGRSTKTKTPIVGMVERKGEIVAKVVDRVNNAELSAMVNENALRPITIYSDSLPAYNGISKPENRVNHSAGQHINGKAHTNTIDGFWGTFKRGYVGIYHIMSRQHLQRYVDEFAFRYNHRDTDSFTSWFGKPLDCYLSYKRLARKDSFIA
jgi:transposase-like protein